MTRKRRVIINVFIASSAAVMLQRGAYFFTHEVLGFTQAQNLWLALFVGVTYIAGATSSHALAARFGERRSLLTILSLLALMHVVLVGVSTTIGLALVVSGVQFLQGAMWPETLQNLPHPLLFSVTPLLASVPQLLFAAAGPRPTRLGL